MSANYLKVSAMSGSIVAIFVASRHREPPMEVDSVQLKQGRGIVGDRFFGFRRSHPGRNLTLIEYESIQEFNRLNNQNVPFAAAGRNIVTRDIRINDLIGKHFLLGNTLCLGVEPCEPCRILARNFACNALPHDFIINAMRDKSGIRAQVLADGIINKDDEIKILEDLNY